jgi:ketosteroid isomerase-like protein
MPLNQHYFGATMGDTLKEWMRIPKVAFLLTGLSILSACATGRSPQRTGAVNPEEAVFNTEFAFAKTMADRNFDAFVGYLSADAVFFDENTVEHGVTEVSAAWKPLFHDPAAPFSWAPDHVEVLASGDLALSTGPVVVKGKVVGRFNSIWRLEAPNTWHIVFDKGESVCPDAAK